MSLYTPSVIAQNVAQVQAQIAEACARVNRPAESVILVAVSKKQPHQAVLAAVEGGVRHFGENRVEEAEDKIPRVTAVLPPYTDEALTWHMIGHVQSRKVRAVVAHFDLVHSVDSLPLASKLSRMAEKGGRVLPLHLQINVSGEASKSGFAAQAWTEDPAQRAELLMAVRHVAALPGVTLRGLMTMAPFVDDAAVLRQTFASLRGLRDLLAESLGTPLPDLSMGMTNDYPIAIEEGATHVRIGRAIFGERL